MISRLRLKNWRSFRDVTIDDLQPINVFIGANSSGKSNLIDALYFTRDSLSKAVVSAVYNRGGAAKILTMGIPMNEPVEIEFNFMLQDFGKPIRYSPITSVTEMTFSQSAYEVAAKQIVRKDGQDYSFERQTVDTNGFPGPFYIDPSDENSDARRLFASYMTYGIRWQILDADFMPPLSVLTPDDVNLFVIDRRATNVVFMLDYMKNTNPQLYDTLQSDLRYLLGHVQTIQVEQDKREVRAYIQETYFPDSEAPTVSSGTARILAMLTAYYALDTPTSTLPGLVVIEEPDTALNPGLLKNFVEQLRQYVDRPEPRQFILTTHNPAFLNYFRPEEVRIVSRDDQGYSHVERVPDYINDIWLDEHGLGDVWLTRSFGGVPE